MPKKMSSGEVKKIAKLVDLNLSSEEIEKLSSMLPETLDYIEILNKLDTADTLATYQVTGLNNVFIKAGENSATLEKEKALANAKEVIEDKFVTEAVFDR